MKARMSLLIVAVGLTGLVSLAARAEDAAAPVADGVKKSNEVRAEAPAGHPGGREAITERFIQRMKAENPEEFTRLQQLRTSNPEAFRKEMRERWQKRQDGGKMQEGGKGQVRGERMERRENKWGAMEDAACLPLVRKFHAAKTPEEAAQAKTELAAALEKVFDEKTADQEARLKKATEELAKRKEKKAEICAKRVELLTKKHLERPAGGKGAKLEDGRRTRANQNKTPDVSQPVPAESK